LTIIKNVVKHCSLLAVLKRIHFYDIQHIFKAFFCFIQKILLLVGACSKSKNKKTPNSVTGGHPWCFFQYHPSAISLSLSFSLSLSHTHTRTLFCQINECFAT
jgi:hypothetical protein